MDSSDNPVENVLDNDDRSLQNESHSPSPTPEQEQEMEISAKKPKLESASKKKSITAEQNVVLGEAAHYEFLGPDRAPCSIDTKFWNLKGGFDKCPRCRETLPRNVEKRKLHFIREHYNKYFPLYCHSVGFEKWLSEFLGCRADFAEGKKNAAHFHDRFCVYCERKENKREMEVYSSRRDLVIHISQVHPALFDDLLKQYALRLEKMSFDEVVDESIHDLLGADLPATNRFVKKETAVKKEDPEYEEQLRIIKEQLNTMSSELAAIKNWQAAMISSNRIVLSNTADTFTAAAIPVNQMSAVCRLCGGSHTSSQCPSETATRIRRLGHCACDGEVYDECRPQRCEYCGMCFHDAEDCRQKMEERQ